VRQALEVYPEEHRRFHLSRSDGVVICHLSFDVHRPPSGRAWQPTPLCLPAARNRKREANTNNGDGDGSTANSQQGTTNNQLNDNGQQQRPTATAS